MWLVEVLVGHWIARRIGWWDMVASENAVTAAIAGRGELAGEWWEGNAGKERV